MLNFYIFFKFYATIDHCGLGRKTYIWKKIQVCNIAHTAHNIYNLNLQIELRKGRFPTSPRVPLSVHLLFFISLISSSHHLVSLMPDFLRCRILVVSSDSRVFFGHDGFMLALKDSPGSPNDCANFTCRLIVD